MSTIARPEATTDGSAARCAVYGIGDQQILTTLRPGGRGGCDR
jgi:hypothetical protein